MNLRITGMKSTFFHYRPQVWTADGRPQPAVTRTLQYAANIASSRNGQHQSAKSLRRRWKHEIQIALLQRRAAMARAVLPNPSARVEWLFAGIIDRALHHWGHVPALDGGPGCTTLTSSQVGLCFVCLAPRGAPLLLFLGSEDGVSTRSRAVVGQPMVQRRPISRIVLRITGSQGNSCSTRSPWKSPSGRGVARCSSLSRLISCSAGSLLPLSAAAGHVAQAMVRNASVALEFGDIHSLAAAAFVTSKLLPRMDLDVAPQQQLPLPPAGPPQPVRTSPGMLTALAASLDRLWPHNALTLHTSWTVQEVIAAEALLLESIN